MGVYRDYKSRRFTIIMCMPNHAIHQYFDKQYVKLNDLCCIKICSQIGQGGAILFITYIRQVIGFTYNTQALYTKSVGVNYIQSSITAKDKHFLI